MKSSKRTVQQHTGIRAAELFVELSGALVELRGALRLLVLPMCLLLG